MRSREEGKLLARAQKGFTTLRECGEAQSPMNFAGAFFFRYQEKTLRNIRRLPHSVSTPIRVREKRMNTHKTD
jgi:hypothetical protein